MNRKNILFGLCAIAFVSGSVSAGNEWKQVVKAILDKDKQPDFVIMTVNGKKERVPKAALSVEHKEPRRHPFWDDKGAYGFYDFMPWGSWVPWNDADSLMGPYVAIISEGSASPSYHRTEKIRATDETS